MSAKIGARPRRAHGRCSTRHGRSSHGPSAQGADPAGHRGGLRPLPRTVGSTGARGAPPAFVSSATVRNDIGGPRGRRTHRRTAHQLPGGSPTDQGYRVFVDQIATVPAARARPSTAPSSVFLEDAQDMDDVMDAGAPAGAADPPGGGDPVPVRTGTTVRHVELVDVGAAVLVMPQSPTSGRVARAVELRTALDEPQLLELRARRARPGIGTGAGCRADAVAGLGETCRGAARGRGRRSGRHLSLLAWPRTSTAW
ncbi:hypothetical protein QJS66_03670 [Kocuria rhizophila]|nr:hypothetical protein QJS66_03670 [Kocuria rhizophila]